MSCFLFVFGQIVCARESLQTHIAGFVDFLLLCLWSTIAFTMHAVSKERIVQTQNFVFGRFSNFFFYPNETWTHPPTSNFFLDFWNFFNFAKPLNQQEILVRRLHYRIKRRDRTTIAVLEVDGKQIMTGMQAV